MMIFSLRLNATQGINDITVMGGALLGDIKMTISPEASYAEMKLLFCSVRSEYADFKHLNKQIFLDANELRAIAASMIAMAAYMEKREPI